MRLVAARPSFHAVLVAVFALAGCAQNMHGPLDKEEAVSLSAESAVVVLSISVADEPHRGLLTGGVLGYEVRFQKFDPEAQSLIDGGPELLYSRFNCYASREGECDFTGPHHQLYSLPAGHYIAKVGGVQKAVIGSGIKVLPFIESDESWWISSPFTNEKPIPESPAARFMVKAGEINYVGDIVLTDAGGGINEITGPPEFRRFDDLAQAAVESFGGLDGPVVYRPAWSGPKRPANGLSESE